MSIMKNNLKGISKKHPRFFSSASLLVGIAVLLGIGYVVWPSSLGGCTTTTIVSGNSMQPIYSPGDFLISRCASPHIGDVAVYQPPGIPGQRLVSHRIVDANDDGTWVLLGDNNDQIDPWRVSDSDIRGIVVVHIPLLGRIISSPFIWLSMLVLAAALYLWRESASSPSPSPEPGSLPSSSGEDAPPAETDLSALPDNQYGLRG